MSSVFLNRNWQEIVALAAFIPIVMGMGGNIGTHPLLSSSVVLLSGEVDIKDTWKVLWREFSTGALLGTTYGILLGGFASLIPIFGSTHGDYHLLWHSLSL